LQKINIRIYLVDGKCGPFSLQQREAHTAAWHVPSPFNGEDKVLTRSGRHVDEPGNFWKFFRKTMSLKSSTDEEKKYLLDIVRKVALIDNGPILQRQLIGRTLDGLHGLPTN
jgi:hypothetical protein